MRAALSIRFLEMGIVGKRKVMPLVLLAGSKVGILHDVLAQAMCSCEGRPWAMGAMTADFKDVKAIFNAILILEELPFKVVVA